MPTDSEIAVVNQYLARLEKAFGHVPSAERDELVEEVRGHVLERLEAAPHVTEQVVNEILRAVGDPRELAAQHKTEAMLRQAVHHTGRRKLSGKPSRPQHQLGGIGTSLPVAQT